jgi:hypothetical protein
MRTIEAQPAVQPVITTLPKAAVPTGYHCGEATEPQQCSQQQPCCHFAAAH